MKYLLLMYANQTEAPGKIPEEQLAEVQQAWVTFMKEARDAGVLLDNNGLARATAATTVRIRNNKTLTTDGPFAETHEQLAGYSVIECKDLDEAIRWATKIPMAKYGSVEIRPLWSPQA